MLSQIHCIQPIVSTETTIYYDVDFEHQEFELIVEDLAPGSVRLSVAAVNNTLGLQYDKVKFDRFVQVPGDRNANATTTVPEFKTSFFYNQRSRSGSIVVTEQEPGIYYYGATPSFEGRAGQVAEKAYSTNFLCTVCALTACTISPAPVCTLVDIFDLYISSSIL